MPLAAPHLPIFHLALPPCNPSSVLALHPLTSPQVRHVSEAQQELRSAGVGLRTHDTLSSAEAAAGKLEQELQQLKPGGK